MLRTLSALVLGIAVSAGAARPSAETGFSLEASKRIRAEHESLCGRLAAALDSIEALRNAYPTAAGKGAAEREALDLPAIQANDEAIQLRKRRLVNRFWDDNKIYGPAVEARARSRRKEERGRETLRLVRGRAPRRRLAAAVAAWAVRR